MRKVVRCALRGLAYAKANRRESVERICTSTGMEATATTASTQECCSQSVFNLDRNFIFHRRILT